jgi:natural product precursor
MMERFGKMKLTQRNRVELEARQMNALRGGGEYTTCGCVCVDDYDVDAAKQKQYNSNNGLTQKCGCVCAGDDYIFNLCG